VSRKPSRKKPTAKAKPDPAQLKAIKRLLEQEDYQAAIPRARTLVRQFPNHGGLRRSLVQALHAAQRPSAAAVAAFDWAEQRRNSLMAHEMAMPKGMFGSILRRMAISSPQPYKRRH
jgi:hypothetical protein